MSAATVIQIDPKSLREPEVNPNSLDKEKFDLLKSAIERYGFLQPVLIREDNTIIDGCHRVRAAKELKLKSIPAIVSTSGIEDARILQIGMNRLRGELDLKIVATTFEELSNDGWLVEDLSLSGFNTDEIQSLIAAMGDADISPKDAAEPVERPKKEEVFALTLHFETEEDLDMVKNALKKKGPTLERALLNLICED